MIAEFTQADIDMAVFLATRRGASRKRLRLPAEEVRRRAYDKETDRLRGFIHGQQVASETHPAHRPVFTPTSRQLEIAIAALEARERREAADAAAKGQAA